MMRYVLTLMVFLSLPGAEFSAAQLTNIGPILLQISPKNGFVAVGVSAQLSATLSFQQNPNAGVPRLNSVSWISTNPSIAKIDLVKEQVVGVAPGIVTILAKTGPFVGFTTMTVIPASTQTGLTLSPKLPMTPKGLIQPFTVMATFQ